MREARLVRPGAEAFVLCSNRLASGVPNLNQKDIAALRSAMFCVLDYAEIEILAYSIVPTGYHVLLHVPKPRRLSDDELLERAARLYESTPNRLQALQNRLEKFSQKTPEGRSVRASHQSRIHQLSAAISNFQQRFNWYLRSKRPESAPKIWADRYKSLPVEHRREVIAQAAAEIDASPRWAKPPRVPSEYPFCGFGEAVAGNKHRRRQIVDVTGCNGWTAARKSHQAAIDSAEKPRRSWNMPRAVGNVPVARLAAAAKRGAAKLPKVADQTKSLRDWLAELRAFKKAHGHCDVPAYWPEHRSLGTWLSRMRTKGRQGTLPDDVSRKLGALGISFEMRSPGARPGAGALQNEVWHEHYQKLVRFKKQHGHCRVPRSFPDDKTFASWIWRQRDAKRRGRIEPEREKLLQALDFDWEPRPRSTKAGQAAKSR